MKRRNLSRIYCLLFFALFIDAVKSLGQWNPDYAISTSSGKYCFSFNQTPDNLVQQSSPLRTGVSMAISSEWQSSSSAAGTFVTVTSAGSDPTTYVFAGPLSTTTFFRRKITLSGTVNVLYSNVIKIEVVSLNWEDLNYVRKHTLLVPGITDWKVVDQMPIGQKLQVTEYSDGLDRSIQTVSRESATPDSDPSGSQWGDVVHFSAYDILGRMPQEYLPYTKVDNTAAGKFKTSLTTDQQQYYSNVYNESAPYKEVTYENSPINRVLNEKSPGASWNASAGVTAFYGVNDLTDNVQIFNIGFSSGDIPVSAGSYLPNTLIKNSKTDEKGRQQIEYVDNTGKTVLVKTQIDASPSAAHAGWSCIYYVYDDFGLLRYKIQPEAVKWLDANSWSFSGTDGQQVLTEMCFRYEYDERGRTTLKKAPGAKELYMIYDSRDRLVFAQDGVQRAKSPGEWLVTMYDDLDRPTGTALYETAETIANLQADINNSFTSTTISQSDSALADVVYDSRVDSSITEYTATNSITFDEEFTSLTNDEFVAEIVSATQTGASATLIAYSNPVPANVMTDASKYTPLTYKFYDNYNYSNVKSFDNGFNNGLAYANSDPAVESIATDARTFNMLTGEMTRVLGSSTFLLSSYYYDERGRNIQILSDNIKSGTDIVTMQYHFDGRLLSRDERHSATGTVYSNFDILSKNTFDKIGRPISIQLKVGTNDFKTISSYDLDDFARIKTKHLDPAYMSGAGLESLDYSFDIQNHITGINKDYALKTPGKYDKWGHYFGLYLGYDNRYGVFAAQQFDGSITGAIWSTQGDDVQRKYDYSYDNNGRLTNALYVEKQNVGDAWSSATMDFSVTGSSGTIQYDYNGNLLSMVQKGVVPGNSSPVNIDDLHYNYIHLSNRLLSVTDNSNAGSANGLLGDFSDGTNGTNDDYAYDDNGNLIVDRNKGITSVGGQTNKGINYNYLDKPETIYINGKGTIQLVYDADGRKLQKIFTPDGGGAAVTTSYVGRYVYIGNNLQYINFEEGRIRVMQAVNSDNGNDKLTLDGNIDLPGTMRGAFDYFIEDHLGNVRMILTEESHLGSNSCTMELSRDANEAPLFGKVDANGQPAAGNEVEARFPVSNIPGQTTGGGWQNSTIGNYVSQLGNLVGQRMGPNTLMKVMAGDQITAQAIYYYSDPVTNSSGGTSYVTDLLASLASAIGGSPVTSSLIHGSAANIVSPLGSSIPFSSTADPDAANALGSAPKAYLAVLFFDERFNFIGEGSTTARVAQSGNGAPALVISGVKAPKNGYAYVYVANESDETVYFDNLKVANVHGAIMEENHYYAFGLKIAGISSKLLPDPNEGYTTNKNLYNDKELIDEADLDWYDYGFRNYDPQIGRFVQLDPMTDGYPQWTPYQYAGNDPIVNTDLDGAEPDYSGLAFALANVGADKIGFALAKTLAAAVVTPTVNQLARFLQVAMKGIQVTSRLALITAGGAADAMAHANTWGIYQVDHTEEYDNPLEKMLYVAGRVTGDALAVIQGTDEIAGGGGAAGGGLAAAIPTGGTSLVASLGGAIVALHGTGTSVTATHDFAKSVTSLYKLYRLYSVSQGETPKNESNGGTSDGANGNQQSSGDHMFGQDGQQKSSRSWKVDGDARVDAENPNPGQRPAQIQYQIDGKNKTKYFFNPNDKYFYLNMKNGTFSDPVSKSTYKQLLKSDKLKQRINDALEWLKEPKAF